MRPSYSRDNRFRQQQSNEKHRINRDILALEVRVIAADGAQLGVLRTREAIQIAEDDGLDLVEVAPEAKPPVCKILNYGKFKYREQKKEAALRKNTGPTIKEIRLRYSTDKHDLETKVKNARRFIDEGDKVKFEMRFRGREVVYQEIGREIFKKVVDALKDVAILEESTPLLGQKMIMIFVPKAQAKVVKK